MILEDPGLLEERLRVLDAHLRSGDGDLIDLLALDAQGGFLLIEIQREAGEDLLARITRHREWVASQCVFLRRLYGAGPINPRKPPRALALSERFEARFLDAIRAGGPGVRALQYRILLSSGHPLLYLEPVEPAAEVGALPAAPAALEFPAPEPERLTAEELEAFYGFERRRLAAERGPERVKA